MHQFLISIWPRSRSILLAGFCLLIIPAFGQKKVFTSNQIWLQSYQEGKISETWTLLLDGGYRWRNGFDVKLAYIVRGGVAYSLSPKMRVGGGFASLGIYGVENVVRQEYRPFQELFWKDRWSKIQLSQRVRIEERFFDDLLLDFVPMDFNFRFRYALMLGIPLGTLSKKNPDRKLILNLGDEIFLNAGNEITHNIFDQNRIIISPTLQWNEDLSLALTYNSQFASTEVAESFLHSHVFWLQVRYNVDLRKKSI